MPLHRCGFTSSCSKKRKRDCESIQNLRQLAREKNLYLRIKGNLLLNYIIVWMKFNKIFIEDQVDNINENDDFLSEDKEMTNRMKSTDDKLKTLQTENSSLKKKNNKNNNLKKRIKIIEEELTQLKMNCTTRIDSLETVIDSLETVTAKPFIQNICTQILKHISGVTFQTSMNSKHFIRHMNDHTLIHLQNYVQKKKYKTIHFYQRADKCIHERNEKFHPLSFDLLRNDAHDALKLIAKSPSLQKQLRFERIVLEIVDDEGMVNAYFS